MRYLYTRKRFLALILPLFLLYTVYTTIPMLFSIYYSFTSYKGLGSPRWNDFANYRRLLTDKYVWQSLQNTLVAAGCMLVFVLPLAFILAYSFRRKSLRNQVYQTMVFAPYIVPSTLTGLLWYFILNPSFGLMNALLKTLGITGPMWIGGTVLSPVSYALAASWANMGFYVCLWNVALKSISGDILEAALIDGCGNKQQIWHIILPMLRENVGSMFILILTSALKIYELVYALTGGGPSYASETIISYMYSMTFTNQTYGYGMTIGVVEFVTAVLVTLLSLWLTRKGTEA